MSKFKNLTGQKFGRLTVMSRAENSKYGEARWNCVCDCKNSVVATGKVLRSNNTKSCGCLKIEFGIGVRSRTHGMGRHPLYIVWRNIKSRCFSPKNPHFNNYGGRGISMCIEWKESFQKFYEDMLEGYEKGLQLDRIDNNKGYSKENCRWVTRKENCNNKRTNMKVAYSNTIMTLSQAVELAGYKYETVKSAIYVHGFYKDIALDNL